MNKTACSILMGLSIAGIYLTAQCNNPVSPLLDTAHFYMKHSFDVQKYTLVLDIYNSFSTPYPKSFSSKEVITFKVDSSLNSLKLNAVNSSLEKT